MTDVSVARSNSRRSSPDARERSMSGRERVRLALVVAVLSLLMSAGGGLAASEGGAVLEMLGSILIIFGVAGLAQAGAIALGYPTPRGSDDVEEADARHD